MSKRDIPIASKPKPNIGFVAPTPQNTPLVGAPITQISRPTVPDTITEGDAQDDDGDDMDDGRGLEDLAMVEVDLPYVVRRRVEGLKGVHLEYQKLEAQYKKELLALDKKVSLSRLDCIVQPLADGANSFLGWAVLVALHARLPTTSPNHHWSG